MKAHEPKNTVPKEETWESDLEEYLRNYYNQMEISISTLGRTLFDKEARKSWFGTLKKLTKYHNYGKRDGSFAKSCYKNN